MTCELLVGEVASYFNGPLWSNHNAYSEQRNKHEYGTIAFLAVDPRAVLCQGFPGQTKDPHPRRLNIQDGGGTQLHAPNLSEPAAAVS